MKTIPRPGRSGWQRISVIALAICLFIGLIIIAMDWKNVRLITGVADWEQSFIAFLFVICSYLCLTFSFTLVSSVFEVRMRRRDLIAIGFVSVTFNNLLDFMSMGGHGLRLMLMERRGIAPAKTLAASLFHSHFHNLGMFCLIPVGLIYVTVTGTVQGYAALGLLIVSVLTIVFIIIATAIIFSRSLRLAVLHRLAGAMRFIARRDVTPFLDSFNEAMAAGVSLMKKNIPSFSLLILLIIGEWGFMLFAFRYCFDAFGSPVSPGVLITGFAVGISAGNLSLLPGGLGVQEASMAGIYSLLGVALERAVFASILFRVVYDFIPFLVSFFFYRRLLRVPAQGPIGKGG